MIVVVFLSSLINLFSSKFEAEKVALQYIDEKYCSTFGAEVDSISKNGKNHYIIGYDISQDHDLWQSKGMIKLSVYKKNDEWMVDVIEENIDYHFEKNDNWYYITGSGNREFLVKMLSLTDKEVTLECYGYDMGSYGGPDDYEHELVACDLEYDGSNRCFRFQFMGGWCINGSYIGYNQFEVGTNYEYYQSSSKKVNILKPVRPDDYWWYDIAKRQTGDYDSSLATDLSQAKVGDIVSLGKYEMDNNISNGIDAISWIVIDENDRNFLLISKFCIEEQQTSSGYQTWETSVAREWLNGDFYNNAFTPEEKTKIITSIVVNNDNPDTGTDGGNDTSDKIFLLSIDEVNKYFASKEERIAYGTLHLQKVIGENEDSLGWWLRTPGQLAPSITDGQIYQSYVTENGYVATEGCSTAVYNNGLRPAMWISK